jgi:response regulator RpfG family c-di-GMP phosphodiesterase
MGAAMVQGDELFEFAAEPIAAEPWHVLIVDDEPAVHEVTRLVLGSFRFEDRPLHFHHAYSAAEARALLRDTPDIGVMLLDVVMESDQAGLELVKYVRQELHNHFVRIVLRTGQPGQAPEHEVITNYDINDYKDKTELTAQKLRTMMYATLRAYRDVMLIERNRLGLERVISASAHIFSHQKSHEFASAVLGQLGNVVGLERGALYCKPIDEPNATGESLVVAAATGDYARFVNAPVDSALPRRLVDSVHRAFERKENLFAEDHYVLHFTDSHSTESLLYVGETPKLRDVDYRLVQLFCTNVSIAFENLHLNKELFESQLEMVYLLAGAAETRSRETANHVRRVGLIAELIGSAAGMDTQEAGMLRFAAPLHDIGKIGIPDAILNKPGAHTAEESVVMRTHAELGAQMLGASRRPLMQLAAQIAREHHENWDGSGYPMALKGAEIGLPGRIVALADVYDALGSNRCYKRAWAEGEVQAFLRGQSGRKFDPALVEVLFAHWEAAEDIRRRLPD